MDKYQAKWRKNNREKYNEYFRRYNRARKEKDIEKLGGKCVLCGESRIQFLTTRKKKVHCYNCANARPERR